MTSEFKKVILLLKAVIFQYHGLDKEEHAILLSTSKKIDGSNELEWALNFIQHDEPSALKRAREYFEVSASGMSSDEKMDLLGELWNDNNKKGYITELEATGMLKIATDWGVQSEFLNLVRSK